LITAARGGKFVLKIANSNDAPELLDCQNQAPAVIRAACSAPDGPPPGRVVADA
jgi:hypothetical protein